MQLDWGAFEVLEAVPIFFHRKMELVCFVMCQVVKLELPAGVTGKQNSCFASLCDWNCQTCGPCWGHLDRQSCSPFTKIATMSTSWVLDLAIVLLVEIRLCLKAFGMENVQL